jgi:hypothetical protein
MREVSLMVALFMVFLGYLPAHTPQMRSPMFKVAGLRLCSWVHESRTIDL